MAIKWQESTQEDYREAMGCVPPAAVATRAFLVGEALNHRPDGSPAFRAFRSKAGEYNRSAEGVTYAEFKAEFPDACRY